jgi:hypothetical protein
VHPASGIPYDVIGEAMGAQEQLQVRRSARVRDLEEEEFESLVQNRIGSAAILDLLARIRHATNFAPLFDA